MGEVEAREIVTGLAAKRADELRSALDQLRGSLEINLSVWSGPEQIPIELLQNADDAFENIAGDIGENRGSILYRATEDYLMVAHDGPPFTEEDVDYISSIGRPHKKPGRQSGWMDFGFKSVFQLTNSPVVLSGPFRFGFAYDRSKGNTESILIPFWIEQVPDEAREAYSQGWTVFYLPYRTDLSELAQFSQRIDFAPLSLVFLRHIRRIRIETKQGVREYVIQPGSSDMHSVVENSDEQVRQHRFRVFSKPVRLPEDARHQDRVVRSGRGAIDETPVSLAFHLDDDGNLLPADGELYYFVPTTIRTGLKFDINGDFLLNAERTGIDRALRWNECLLRGAGELALEAIGSFKRHRKWKYQFYEVLPTGDEPALDIAQGTVVQPIRSHCQKNPVILSEGNRWLIPSHTAIAPTRLHKVLEARGLGLQGFVNPRVSGLDFIRSLQVEDFTGDKEGEVLIRFVSGNASRLGSLPPKWFVRLYSYLSESLFSKDLDKRMTHWFLHENRIRELRLVLTENKSVERPKDAVYPSRVRGIPKAIAKRLKFVHAELVRARGVRSVLVDGLSVPVFSATSAVEYLVKAAEEGTAGTWSSRQRWEALRFLHAWSRRERWDVSPTLRQRLAHVLVPTKNTWVPAGKAYLSFPGLNELIPEAPVASLLQGASGESRAAWENTLKTFGVVACPRVDSLDGEFTRWGATNLPVGVHSNWEAYWRWLGGSEIGLNEYTSYQRLKGVHWAPWLALAAKLQPEQRRQPLQVILSEWNSYYRHFAQTRYEWFYYTGQHRQVSSFFRWQLRYERWLPTTHGVMSAASYVLAPLRQVRAIIGDLAPYVDCDEASAKNSRSFFEDIGVKAELDRDTLISVLLYLQGRQLPINYWTDGRLGHLKEAYRLLAQQIDEGEYSGKLVLPLLGEDRQFRDSSDLVWKDDPELGAVFPEFERYAWEPAVERPLIQRLFDSAGVQRLSRLVDVTVVGDGAWEPVQWRNTLAAKGDFLYSLAVHHRPEVVESLLPFLQDAPQLMGHLDLRLKLRWNDDLRLVPVPAYYEADPTCLHLSQSASASDVAFALAKGLGIPEQTEQVERILSEGADELRRRFGRWGIAIVALPQPSAPTGETPDTTIALEATRPAETETPAELPTRASVDTRAPQAEEEPSIPSDKTQRPIPFDRTWPVGRRTPAPMPRPHIPSVVPGPGATDATARRLAELEAMRIAKWYEETVRGRTVTDVSAWESYDLEAVDPASPEKVERYIEVKARFSAWPVELTDPEKERAGTLAEDYWLYVVTRTEVGYALYMTQDPVNSAQIDLREHYAPMWRVVGWEFASPHDVPSDAGQSSEMSNES